jgi:release factor glutamine methyltransferase
LTESEYASFCQKIVKYYEENYPAPYLNQRVSFYQLFFSTKKGVFIPQKDTERLIEKLLELAEKKWSKKKLRVLDIGTGCGNIVVSLAKIKPD